MSAIVSSLETRLSRIKLENPDPKAPTLSTAARAERRRKHFEDKMDKLYGKQWRDGIYKQSSADRICQKSIATTRHSQPFKSFFSKTKN